jgi:hypothetical protein
MGVDLGIPNTAFTSHGTLHSGAELKSSSSSDIECAPVCHREIIGGRVGPCVDSPGGSAAASPGRTTI